MLFPLELGRRFILALCLLLRKGEKTGRKAYLPLKAARLRQSGPGRRPKGSCRLRNNVDISMTTLAKITAWTAQLVLHEASSQVRPRISPILVGLVGCVF